MTSPLNKRIVWLTGASSGLGESLARELARAGAILMLTARREEVLQKLAEDLQNQGARVKIFPADVTSLEEMRRVVEEIRAEFGRIDVMIANAGTHIPTRIDTFSLAEVEEVFRLNFFGVINCIDATLPLMLSQGQGHLVAVSSVAGYRGLPYAAAYGASKAALTHFMESFRFEAEQRGVNVSVVSPGFVRTPLTDKNDFPMPFLMEPSDAARAMLQGIERKSLEIHFPKRFTFLIKFFRIIPYPLYHWIIKKTVLKND